MCLESYLPALCEVWLAYVRARKAIEIGLVPNLLPLLSLSLRAPSAAACAALRLLELL